MIKKLLGPPDETAPNPRYRNAAPMRLYDAARVEKVEKTDEFAAAKAKADAQRAVSTAVAERRRRATLAEVDRITVSVMVVDKDELLRRAIEHYNCRNRDYGKLATINCEKDFLDRIAVNYLRHECTSYDESLDALYKRVGKREASSVIREKTYDAIEEAYPWLGPECRRQLDERERQDLYENLWS